MICSQNAFTEVCAGNCLSRAAEGSAQDNSPLVCISVFTWLPGFPWQITHAALSDVGLFPMTSLSTRPTLNTDTCDSSDNKQEGKLNPKLIMKRGGRKGAVCVWQCPGELGVPAAPSVQEQVSCVLLSSGQPAVERVYLDTRTAMKN